MDSRIVIREFEEKKDARGVEAVEMSCEVGPPGKLSLYTHLLGDPICRIRHSPAFLMLVAELHCEEQRMIVGMVRGCIKTVTCAQKLPTNNTAVYTKLGYLLGLRVSPSHRRMRTGLKLVLAMEEWFKNNAAVYSYMATESDNLASLNLFTHKCGYSNFRTPTILVQPVFAHRLRVSPAITIIKLTPSQAQTLYRTKLSTTEFFPTDIAAVLGNTLTLGTFLAIPRAHAPSKWASFDDLLAGGSWALLSVWNSNDVWRMEIRGASRFTRGLAKTTRFIDRAMPWLKIPSVPQLFSQFGFHFLYGLGGEGPMATKLLTALCAHAHNLAKERGCAVVVTEVAAADPLRLGIPHWKSLSCAQDLWCIKRLGEDYSDGSVGDWTKSTPATSIFVDPREF